MPAGQDQTASAVLLLGPTASGKSALALSLAQRLPLEIVSVDSAQVYRGFNIGTAKPSASERAQVPHHLIDLRDPLEPYSAADFVSDATTCIASILRRGAVPLLVGGTMLYAHALLRGGLAPLPSADPQVRARLDEQARTHGWPAMHAHLATFDPVTAARLGPNDSQRIQRAIEVYELSGQPLSSWHAAQAAAQAAATARSADAIGRLTVVALLPGDRAALHQRIAARFDAMLTAGFVDEVRRLKARRDLHADLPAMRAVGYRQAWRHLAEGTSLDAFRNEAVAATRQLARRQITWLRSMQQATVVDPLSANALDAVHGAVLAAVTPVRGGHVPHSSDPEA